MFRTIINFNVALCKRLDGSLWPRMSIDGNRRFIEIARASVPSGVVIADVGGGKSPLFSPEEVAAKRLSVIGIDIDGNELAAAPHGAYAKTAQVDITSYKGDASADVVLVQSLLEHVANNSKGIKGIASICKPGGQIFTFCPNRRAWFAILNRLLPEGAKRYLLHSIYPHTRRNQGFPAYYDRCTPAEMTWLMEREGLKVVQVLPFFVSSYFRFFFPLYLFWRLVTLPLMKVWPLHFCETFMIVARKPLSG